MKYIPLTQLPELTQEEMDSRKWYASMYPEIWHEQKIPDRLLRVRDGYYDEFCIWFTKNCEGHWALPRSHSLLFTHEEDQVKFILKFL